MSQEVLAVVVRACVRACVRVNDGALVFQGDLVAAGILSGNRNFEGRVHPNTRANYLASPPLVIAYAIAGTVRIDFDTEPIGGSGGGAGAGLRCGYCQNNAFRIGTHVH